MTKASNNNKPAAKAKAQQPLVVPAPWACRHEPSKSCVDAYVEATGEWETIAEVSAQKGVDAKATAEFIARLANDNDRGRDALRAAMAAIEELLSCAGKNLTFDAEQEADVAERKIKELLRK